MMTTPGRRQAAMLVSGFLFLAPLEVASAGVPDTAQYSLRFHSIWSRDTHPVDFPGNPHFSPLIGGVHNSSVRFWEVGGIASAGIEEMAELGQTRGLEREVEDAVAAGHAAGVVLGDDISRSPGSATASFIVSREFPLITLVSMLAPSPDWFVGVSGLSMFENGTWVERKILTAYTYDAGTDSGPSYNSSNADTRPAEPIGLLEAGPFANATPVGTLVFARVNVLPPPPIFLNDGRFKVEAEWANFEGSGGHARAEQLTDDTGYLWFFNPANVEVVVKVLDGCGFNDRFWVFAGGLTNVEVELRVEDTETGQVNVYANELGRPFQPIQDLEAFAACP